MRDAPQKRLGPVERRRGMVEAAADIVAAHEALVRERAHRRWHARPVRHVPECEQRPLLAGAVAIGAVDEPRVTDQHVARAHRHSHLVRVRAIGRVVRVLIGLERVRMRRSQMVERVVAKVRARDHLEAAVLRTGVGEVNHHEQLVRAHLVARQIVPAPPILVPEERRPARRLRDQEPARPARVGRAQPAEQHQDRRAGDDVGIFGIVGEVDQRAVGSHRLPRRLAFAEQRRVGAQPERVDELAVENARGVDEAVAGETLGRAEGRNGRVHGSSLTHGARPISRDVCSGLRINCHRLSIEAHRRRLRPGGRTVMLLRCRYARSASRSIFRWAQPRAPSVWRSAPARPRAGG